MIVLRIMGDVGFALNDKKELGEFILKLLNAAESIDDSENTKISIMPEDREIPKKFDRAIAVSNDPTLLDHIAQNPGVAKGPIT
jgi:hypothetical protein